MAPLHSLELTEIRKTLTPWSSASVAVMRMLFSLALSICICAHSFVFRMSRRLPWVRITAARKPLSYTCPNLQPTSGGGQGSHALGEEDSLEQGRWGVLSWPLRRWRLFAPT